MAHWFRKSVESIAVWGRRRSACWIRLGLLQALNTGHAGSPSTIHANSVTQALSRFTNCVLQANVELPYPAIRALIADSVGLVVHLARDGSRRVVRELTKVERYDHASDRFLLAAVPVSTT